MWFIFIPVEPNTDHMFYSVHVELCSRSLGNRTRSTGAGKHCGRS